MSDWIDEILAFVALTPLDGPIFEFAHLSRCPRFRAGLAVLGLGDLWLDRPTVRCKCA
jgi:hypothetical protein